MAEDTLTNLLLVGLSAFNGPAYRIRAHAPGRERWTGADWEMWMGSVGGSWLGLRIQAKAIDLHTAGFPHLHYRGKGAPLYQSDTLIRSALSHYPPVLPLYLLYTYVPNGLARPWPCGSFAPRSDLYGCSLVSAFVVRSLRLAGGHNGLTDLEPSISPWHCLACCRHHGSGSLAERALGYLNSTVIIADRAGRNFSAPSNTSEPNSLSATEVERLSRAYFEHRLWGAPPDYVAPIVRGEESELPEDLAAVITIVELPPTL